MNSKELQSQENTIISLPLIFGLESGSDMLVQTLIAPRHSSGDFS
jgi:hypothetical protein